MVSIINVLVHSNFNLQIYGKQLPELLTQVKKKAPFIIFVEGAFEGDLAIVAQHSGRKQCIGEGPF